MATASQAQRCPPASEMPKSGVIGAAGHHPTFAISGMQTHSCVLRPLGFRLHLPCLPITQTPSQVKAVDTGQLTRDQLPSIHTEGLVKVTLGTTKKGGGSPDLGGSQRKGDARSQRTHPCALRAERLAQRGRGGCRNPGSKHLSFGCLSPSPVSCLCFKPPAKGTVSTTTLHNLL